MFTLSVMLFYPLFMFLTLELQHISNYFYNSSFQSLIKYFCELFFVQHCKYRMTKDINNSKQGHR